MTEVDEWDGNWEEQLSPSICNECGEPILPHQQSYDTCEGSWHIECAVSSGEVDY